MQKPRKGWHRRRHPQPLGGIGAFYAAREVACHACSKELENEVWIRRRLQGSTSVRQVYQGHDDDCLVPLRRAAEAAAAQGQEP